MPDLGAVGGWAVAIVTAIIAAIVSLLPKKGSLENTRIDQLQEDLAAERAERKELATEVKSLRDDAKGNTEELQAIRAEQSHLARRDLAWMMHYELVKQGVEAGNIPPWPPLPEILGGPHD